MTQTEHLPDAHLHTTRFYHKHSGSTPLQNLKTWPSSYNNIRGYNIKYETLSCPYS